MCQEIERLAQREGARKVEEIIVRIGALSGVEREAFVFAFEAYQRNHPLFEGAKLRLEWVPAQNLCLLCQERFEVTPPCPRCGSWKVVPISGNELELSRVEFLI
jgi:hydrogenase nickel incorporation protein HypA/HybF